jgi:hypothetical protein
MLDLVAWDRGLRAKSLLKPESWAMVYEPVTLNSGKHYLYGFGWIVREAAGQKVYEHHGNWQGFKTRIVRYQGDDLTVIALANLAQAQPDRFCSGIVAIVAPHLIPKPVAPPGTDSNPALLAQLKRILAATAEGVLAPDDFAYLRAGFFPEGPKRYQEMLRLLGGPQKITLTAREELGDDVVSHYEVEYREQVFQVVLGTAPDGKISEFNIQRKPVL